MKGALNMNCPICKSFMETIYHMDADEMIGFENGVYQNPKWDSNHATATQIGTLCYCPQCGIIAINKLT